MTLVRTAVISAVVLAALTNVSEAQTPKRGGVLTHYVTNDPPNLDCHQSVSIFLQGLIRPVYSTLVRFNQNDYSQILPDLAQSWTISPDGKTYTFKLAPNVKFHDGSAFTAADVKATFDRIRNPPQGVPSLRRADYTDVTAIDAPDDQTVVFRLASPNSALLNLIADPYNCVYSARKLAENPRYPETQPMGTGAFQFVSYTKGSDVTGKKFDAYFRQGLPYLDGYRTFVMAEPAAIGQIQTGGIDMSIRGFPPQQRETIRLNMGDKITVDSATLTLVNLVTFNLKRKPFDDVRVRKALSLAIDRKGVEPLKKIVNLADWGGFMRPGYPLALPKADADALLGVDKGIDAARAEARRLLAEAGQSNLKAKLLNNDTGTYLTLGPFLVAQWQAIGVQVEQDIKPGTQYTPLQVAGDFDITLETNNVGSDDPTVVLSKYLPGAPANFGGITDPMIAELFNKQRGETDAAQRKQTVAALERRMLDQMYIAPLFWALSAPTFRSYVKNWKATPNFSGGYDLTEVWLDK